ncbi:MAG: SDR family NAD(P)-dependent oxidoreductase [Chitinophagaceae bacterium]|nr:SDR family NAD(P)-dependent oxidoreductase [Chitinophagaceae bacterium]
MSTILVTGGTGFLGAYIIRDLVNAGYTVRAIRRSKHIPFFIDPEIFKKVQWFDCDLGDIAGLEEAMTGADAVIHAAGKVSFREKDGQEMRATNIEGTANLVNIALEKKTGRFIHVSSVAALDKQPDGKLTNEEKKWDEHKKHTRYAVSKYHAEMEVWRGIAEGLNAVIANPTTILGYGDWNASSCALFKNGYKGFPWYSSGGSGFVDVEDVSKAILLLLQSDIAAERFIINGDNWPFRRVFNAIADAFGKKRPYRKATPFLGALAWRVEAIRSFFTDKKSLVTRETARMARHTVCFDNSKILKALPGFSFTPLDQTINKACNQYAARLQRL